MLSGVETGSTVDAEKAMPARTSDAAAFRVWTDAEREQLRLLAAAAPVFDVSDTPA
jgi:hypothetical protein